MRAQVNRKIKKRKKTVVAKVVKTNEIPEKEIVPDDIKILYIREFKREMSRKYNLD